jgi:ATP-binding cassette, subfamily B, bacterial
MSIPFAQYWVLLAARLRPQRGWVLALSLLLLGSTGLQLVAPQVLRRFIDAAQAGEPLAVLVRLALLFLVIALLKYGLMLGTNYTGQVVGWRATNALRSELVRHCLHLDMGFHNQHSPGKLIERVDGDVGRLNDLFSQLLIRALGSLLLLAGVLVALYSEDWRVGSAFTLFTLLALVILYNMREVATPHLEAERQASAELFGFIEERLGGTEDIRANGGNAYTLRRLFEFMRNRWRHDMRAYQRIATLRTTILTLFSLGTLLSLIMGAYLFWAGALTIGTVYLIYAYVQLLWEPVEQLALESQNLQQASASLQRVGELLQTRSPLRDGCGAHLPASGALAGSFEKVAFRYPVPAEKLTENGNEELVLDNISFTLAPGTVLGVLGRTGSGKSTLARLLLRLYDPTAGAICLQGYDLRTLPMTELRRSVGVVTQEVQIFHATVRENLTLFDPTISDSQLERVIGDLGLADWFSRLPARLDTMLEAGSGGLSAGEAQLLALTRIFLRNPGLVILDEASSRLDPATERLVEQAIERLLVGRTAIVIAHRLATVQRAEQILILENGQMVEYGKRAQLAADPASRFAHLLHVGVEKELV